MDWGSRCLRGLVARELSSDDSENKWEEKSIQIKVQRMYASMGKRQQK